MTDIHAQAVPAVQAEVNQGVIRLAKEDITTLAVEAFVFYARSDLELGPGFGSAITRRGGPTVKKELDAVGSIPLTDAVITSGGNLAAKHIVHAVGPTFQEEGLEEKLRATIVSALKRAEERGITQIAFPPMGAGFYGVPLPLCAELMVTTIASHLSTETAIREVVLCANDQREFNAFTAALATLTRSAA